MKATIKFNLDDPDDRENYARVNAAQKMWNAIGDFKRILRSETKHGEDEARVKFFEEVREKFYECLNDNAVPDDYF